MIILIYKLINHLIGFFFWLGTYEFGSEYPNHTYSGALGLLQSNKGDIFLQPGTQFFIKDFFEHSKVNSAIIIKNY